MNCHVVSTADRSEVGATDNRVGFASHGVSDSGPMDLRFTEEQERFRSEAREWLEANAPSEKFGRERLGSLDTESGFEEHRAWERRMFDARLSVVSWPEPYGGRGAGLWEWLVFEEEYYRAEAPTRVGQNGIFLLAPTMFEFGTTSQKERFLPPMASGEEIWCQGWSEPDAGSDLASIRSTARRSADGTWRLNGQKTWCSRGAFADWIFGLFRSDPESERHRGLTYFLVPLDAPGITVRPIAQIDGETGFAEVFFDDVEVADDQVLGEVGNGWGVAMSTAGSERGMSLRSPARYTVAAGKLVSLYAQCAKTDPARAAADCRQGRACVDLGRGVPPPYLLDRDPHERRRTGGGRGFGRQDPLVGDRPRGPERGARIARTRRMDPRPRRKRGWVARRVPFLSGRADLCRDERDPAQRGG